jgi:tripartite-type tricarboxylate transporter receptor subunit TctC
VVKILGDPAVREKSERTGNFPVTSSPEQFSVFIRKEADRWGKVMKEAAIKID